MAQLLLQAYEVANSMWRQKKNLPTVTIQVRNQYTSLQSTKDLQVLAWETNDYHVVVHFSPCLAPMLLHAWYGTKDITNTYGIIQRKNQGELTGNSMPHVKTQWPNTMLLHSRHTDSQGLNGYNMHFTVISNPRQDATTTILYNAWMIYHKNWRIGFWQFSEFLSSPPKLPWSLVDFLKLINFSYVQLWC